MALLLFVQLLSRQSQQTVRRSLIECREGFQFTELSGKDSKIIDQSTFETTVAKAFTQRDIVTATASDFTRQFILNDIDLAASPLIQILKPAARLLPSDDTTT